jgi:hypothetical protein
MKLRISDDVALPLDWMAMATVIYGARGSGKTTLGSVAAEEVTKAKQRFCAVDVKGDWYGLKSSANGREPGIPVVIFGGDHADLPLEEGAGHFVGETVAALEQSVILDLEALSKGKQIRFLSAFFSTLYDKNREPLLLLLDEAQRYAPQRPMNPEAQVCLGAVEDLVKLGRKHGIGIVLMTQRGSGLNKEVSEICDMLVAFRTPGPLDQDRVRDWLEANVTKEQRDHVLGLLAGLETGTAVFASGHPSLKLFTVATVRERETFDSSATPMVGQRRKEPRRLAQPDLEALKVKMATAIERAKQDDPRELRRLLAEARADLAKKNTVLAEADRRTKKIDESLDRVKRIEVELVKPATLQEIRRATAALEAISQRGEAFLERTKAIMDGFREGHARLGTAALQLANALQTRLAKPAAPLVQSPEWPKFRFTTERPETRTRVGAGPGEKMAGGERRILTALAQYPQGRTKAQVAILAQYAVDGGGFQNLLGALRTKGWIEGADPLAITEAGATALGAYEPLPRGRDLLDHWLRKLGRAERAILETVASAYPRALTKEAIAEKTGYEATGGGFQNALGRLRTLELVVGRAEIRAVEGFFE